MFEGGGGCGFERIGLTGRGLELLYNNLRELKRPLSCD